MIAGYTADTDALGIGRPDHEPKATETIGPIISLIEALIAAGHAYESAGDVYFRVRSFPAYGQLSNRDADAMDQGEEAGSAELKEDRLDFALWKARKEDEDTAWPSPGARDARAGTSSARRWPRSCSASSSRSMAAAPTSSSPTTRTSWPRPRRRGERPLAKIWMHIGMVQTRHEAGEAEKMAKSVGNVFLLGEAIARPRARGGRRLPPLRALPPADRASAAAPLEEAAAAQPAHPRVLPRRPRTRRASPGRTRALAARGFPRRRSPTTSTPRVRWPSCSSCSRDARREPLPGAHAVRRRAARAARPRIARGGNDGVRAMTRRRRCWPSAQRARAERDFDRADEIRDRLGELGWEVRDTAEGARLVRRGSLSAGSGARGESVYGRNPVARGGARPAPRPARSGRADDTDAGAS